MNQEDYLDEELNRAFYQELDRFCSRCDQIWYKCSCAETLDLLDDREEKMKNG